MDEARLETWLSVYGEAWERRDPDAAAALFSEDAVYAETPFEEPARGKDSVRAYWEQAVCHHRDIDFSYRVLDICGETCYVWWGCTFTRATTGVRSRLDGIFLLRFDDAGLCRELKEWWFIVDV